MKTLKLVLAIMVSVPFFSCSEEEQREIGNGIINGLKDMVIGDWTLIKKESGNEQLFLTGCQRNTVLQIEADDTVTLTSYDQGTNDNTCQQTDVVEGTWDITKPRIVINDISYNFGFLNDREELVLEVNLDESNPDNFDQVTRITYTRVNN